MKIVMGKELHEKLKEVVFSTQDETGALLLGTYEGENARVLHLIGPGDRAKHHKYHYQADHAYQEKEYNRLLKEQPDWVHIGELHVHPGTMRELSYGDYRTIRKVMKTYDRYVAGVILREIYMVECRCDRSPRMKGILGNDLPFKQVMKVYPVYFTKEKEEYCELVVE